MNAESKTEVLAEEVSVDKKPLVIFKTEADLYGRDIAAMSNFFEGYVQQMSLSLIEQSKLEVVKDLPIANLGILNEVVNQAEVIMQGNITLLPDFDSLSLEIKSKLKKGMYTVGESKQVDGNLRAVILDENGVRIKDITLKRVISNPSNLETVRSIGNQLQMKQIYAKLADIQELQFYQIEKDRDRDIIIPFLDARSLVLEAEQKELESERIALLREADGKMRTALNAIYADIETTSKSFVRRTYIPFFSFGKQMNTYMGFLTQDFQIATKYVGIRMQLLEYMGDTNTAKEVLQLYQHVMYDFLTKPKNKNGLPLAMLMHNYFPYAKSNLDCWYNFCVEMKPALELSMENLKLSLSDKYSKNAFVVSVEDAIDE